ncbi:hypothetical protein ABZP36_033221 [Zizania latifolia]
MCQGVAIPFPLRKRNGLGWTRDQPFCKPVKVDVDVHYCAELIFLFNIRRCIALLIQAYNLDVFFYHRSVACRSSSLGLFYSEFCFNIVSFSFLESTSVHRS